MGEKKILVIDDEVSVVNMLKTRLEASHYSVILATDGLTGFNLARKEKPDLIILDLMLPKMDGHKVCALIKKDKRFALIPIILLTAKAHEDDKKIGEEVGANAYITKPFTQQDLLQKINTLLPASTEDSHGKT